MLASRFADAFGKITDAVRCFESGGMASQAGRAYVSLGRVYRAHGRLDAALDQYARAVALQQDGSDRLAEVQSLNAISVTLFAMGRYAEAGERMQEAIAIARSLKSQRTVQFLLANSAGFSIDLGHYSDAAAALEEVLAGAPTAGVRVTSPRQPRQRLCRSRPAGRGARHGRAGDRHALRTTTNA